MKKTVAAILLLLPSSALGEHSDTERAGLLPIPQYTASVETRDNLTGNWCGDRTALAEKGVQLNLDWTQAVQSVTDGGNQSETVYGTNFDYGMMFDLMRMGILPGALMMLRIESRYGESVNGSSGTILPVNTDALFPLTSKLDDDVGFSITSLAYAQFLSEEVVVMLGKLQTLDGDPNEFASGRGITQFMNANFIFSPALALRLPYSTLGAGVTWIPIKPGAEGGLVIKNVLMTTVDSSETTGLETFDDGLSWTIEADAQYRFGDLPGGQNVGFLYSFDQDFAKIDTRLVFQPGQGLSIPQENSTWGVFWSGWQYLHVEDPSDAPISLINRKADHQGIGVFWRAGIADQDTNPLKWTISAGVGGRGVFDRTEDTYGLGFYYTETETGRFLDRAGVADEAHGLEAFYNVGITGGVQLTVDMQGVEAVLPNADDAFILGARLRVLL